MMVVHSAVHCNLSAPQWLEIGEQCVPGVEECCGQQQQQQMMRLLMLNVHR